VTTGSEFHCATVKQGTHQSYTCKKQLVLHTRRRAYDWHSTCFPKLTFLWFAAWCASRMDAV